MAPRLPTISNPLLRQELPRAELVSLPDAGHSLLSAPVLPLVLAWLQRTLAP